MRTLLEWIAAAFIVGVLVASLAGCTNDAVIPQQVVSPSWTPKPPETRPLFTSCIHASIAGAPLPLVVGDPGWNPRLDHDRNGVIC
jgi:hypothetical protein